MSALPPVLRWLATPFAAPHAALTRGANLQQLEQTAVELGLQPVQVEGRGVHRFQGLVDGIRVHVDPVFKPMVYVLFSTQKPLRLDWKQPDSRISSCAEFEPPDPEFRRVFRRSVIELSYDQEIPDERLGAFAVELVAFSRRWRGALDSLVIDDDGIRCHIGYVPLAPRVEPETLFGLVPDVVSIARAFDIFGDGGEPVELQGHFPKPVGDPGPLTR